MQIVGETQVVAGRGLAGDRYHAGVGSFSRWPDSGRAVTLIEQEAIEAILRETGIDRLCLDPLTHTAKASGCAPRP
jgi:hypothetical protein